MIISDFKEKVGEPAGVKCASSSVIKFFNRRFGPEGNIEPTESQHPVPKGGEFSAWCITGGPHYYSLSLAI